MYKLMNWANRVISRKLEACAYATGLVDLLIHLECQNNQHPNHGNNQANKQEAEQN
jgi:hypothetical protein